jgi:hypothetical protein
MIVDHYVGWHHMRHHHPLQYNARLGRYNEWDYLSCNCTDSNSADWTGQE